MQNKAAANRLTASCPRGCSRQSPRRRRHIAGSNDSTTTSIPWPPRPPTHQPPPPPPCHQGRRFIPSISSIAASPIPSPPGAAKERSSTVASVLSSNQTASSIHTTRNYFLTLPPHFIRRYQMWYLTVPNSNSHSIGPIQRPGFRYLAVPPQLLYGRKTLTIYT